MTRDAGAIVGVTAAPLNTGQLKGLFWAQGQHQTRTGLVEPTRDAPSPAGLIPPQAQDNGKMPLRASYQEEQKKGVRGQEKASQAWGEEEEAEER